MMASFKGHADIVQILIEKAAVIDKKDSVCIIINVKELTASY